MGPFFIPIVGGAVIGMLALLMWAARIGRPRVDPETGALLFRHSAIFRGFSLFAAFGIPLGITVLVIFHPPKKEGDVGAIISIYALFAVLSAPLLWESMRFALTVSAEGLDCRSPWRGRRFIAWDEVQDISFSKINSWFIIRAADGWKFRVSTFVPGLTHFLEACEDHLRAVALEQARPGYELLGRPFPREDEWPDDDRPRRGDWN
jgi:hypothetical protein